MFEINIVIYHVVNISENGLSVGNGFIEAMVTRFTVIDENLRKQLRATQHSQRKQLHATQHLTLLLNSLLHHSGGDALSSDSSDLPEGIILPIESI